MDRFKSIFIVILFIISGQFIQAGASRVSTSELDKLREAYSGFLPEYKVDSAILYSRKILDFHDKEKLTDAGEFQNPVRRDKRRNRDLYARRLSSDSNIKICCI